MSESTSDYRPLEDLDEGKTGKVCSSVAAQKIQPVAPFSQESRCIKNSFKCHACGAVFLESTVFLSSSFCRPRQPKCNRKTRKGGETKATTRTDRREINFPSSQNTDSGVFIKSLRGVFLFIRFGILRERRNLFLYLGESRGIRGRSHTL
jgi:hypothetical protein